MSGASPGPWRWVRYFNTWQLLDAKTTRAFDGDSGDGEPIVTASSYSYGPSKSTRALIAAAPEMVALLRRLSERWNADYHCCDRERGHADDCPLAAADALLARLSTESVKR